MTVNVELTETFIQTCLGGKGCSRSRAARSALLSSAPHVSAPTLKRAARDRDQTGEIHYLPFLFRRENVADGCCIAAKTVL